MKSITVMAFAAMLWAVPAAASEALPPTPGDAAQIDKLIVPFIAGLKAGKAGDAINAYMATNALTRQKTTEIDYVALQAQTVLTTYGPISECQLVETQSRGSWAQTRLYICQHTNYLTRWVFTVMKTPQGWQAANFRYDDKFSNPIDQ